MYHCMKSDGKDKKKKSKTMGNGLTAAQKKLPKFLQQKIMESKNKDKA